MRTAEKLNNSYEKSLEKRDPIYLEPLHKTEEVEKVLRRGGIDDYFLIIVLAL